jgi:hypothetical protein
VFTDARVDVLRQIADPRRRGCSASTRPVHFAGHAITCRYAGSARFCAWLWVGCADLHARQHGSLKAERFDADPFARRILQLLHGGIDTIPAIAGAAAVMRATILAQGQRVDPAGFTPV